MSDVSVGIKLKFPQKWNLVFCRKNPWKFTEKYTEKHYCSPLTSFNIYFNQAASTSFEGWNGVYRCVQIRVSLLL